jgi:hypothetical protein
VTGEIERGPVEKDRNARTIEIASQDGLVSVDGLSARRDLNFGSRVIEPREKDQQRAGHDASKNDALPSRYDWATTHCRRHCA